MSAHTHTHQFSMYQLLYQGVVTHLPSLRVPHVRRVPPPSLWTTAECSQPHDNTHSTDTAPDPKTCKEGEEERGRRGKGRKAPLILYRNIHTQYKKIHCSNNKNHPQVCSDNCAMNISSTHPHFCLPCCMTYLGLGVAPSPSYGQGVSAQPGTAQEFPPLRESALHYELPVEWRCH